MEGWISLYRKFMGWKWYKNSNVKAVFIHLLLCANHKEGMVNNRIVKRGQLITSVISLSDATGLSVQKVRTCIEKLKSTNDIECVTTNKYTIITIPKYDIYQKNFELESTNKITSKSTNQNNGDTTNKNGTFITNKNNSQSIENKELKENREENITSKNNDTSTNQNNGDTTNKITGKLTTNNNNINNIYNNNLTKLNYIFNLIIYNNACELKIEDSILTGFKNIMKKLDFEITEKSINLIPEKQKLEYEVIYITLLSLYSSSYMVYFNKLTREKVLNKLRKTEEYIRKIERITRK